MGDQQHSHSYEDGGKPATAINVFLEEDRAATALVTNVSEAAGGATRLTSAQERPTSRLKNASAMKNTRQQKHRAAKHPGQHGKDAFLLTKLAEIADLAAWPWPAGCRPPWKR